MQPSNDVTTRQVVCSPPATGALVVMFTRGAGGVLPGGVLGACAGVVHSKSSTQVLLPGTGLVSVLHRASMTPWTTPCAAQHPGSGALVAQAGQILPLRDTSWGHDGPGATRPHLDCVHVTQAYTHTPRVRVAAAGALHAGKRDAATKPQRQWGGVPKIWAPFPCVRTTRVASSCVVCVWGEWFEAAGAQCGVRGSPGAGGG
jgi:hypothetical protein